ncbi:MAG: potassium channel family protein [Candidatus Sumerlaeota bacterium]
MIASHPQFLLILRLLRRVRQSQWFWALMLMFLTVSTGVVGFMALTDLPFLHALYATLLTVSTLGSRDIAYDELLRQTGTTPADIDRLIAFQVVLIVVGIMVVAYAFSIFVRSMVEGELREVIGEHRTQRRLFFMKNHYIVCGFGRMGAIIAQTLINDRMPVVVIEQDGSREAEIKAIGVTCIIGDATDDEILRKANIDKAQGLIAVTNSDPENLFVTISARQLNPELNIVSRAVSPDAARKLRRAGANRVILPYKIGAHQLAQAALRPNVLDFIEIASRTSKLDIEIEEIRVPTDSLLDGKTLSEATILRDLELIVIGIRPAGSDSMRYHPSASTQIGAGDTLIALGKNEKLLTLRKKLD